MNIYFCDVCGVRVTDTDLQSGHGMRRRNDVVCAACLELGHGKGLLAQSDARSQLVGAGVAAAPAQSATNGAPAHAPTNGAHSHGTTPAGGLAVDPLQARDRIRTLDEDVPPSPVTPVSLAPEAPESPAEKAAEAPLEDTAKVAVVHQELASTAAGFAALNATSVQDQEQHAADEDVDEVPPNKLDDSGGAPVLAPVGDDDPEKAETTSSQQVEAAPGDTTKPRTDRGNRRATSSSRVTKQPKSRSARRGRSGKNPQTLYLFSGMASVAVILFGVILFRSLNDSEHGKSRVTVTDNVTHDLKDAISEARMAIRAASDAPDDHGKTVQALDAINRAQRLSVRWEQVAKENKISDDDMDAEMDRLGLSDVLGQRKAMEDLSVKNSH